MSIKGIRFRMEGELCVLQVSEKDESYTYGGHYSGQAQWRDAKATDLLQVAAFTRAYDALDRNIDSLTGLVSSLQDQVGKVLDRQIEQRQ